MKVLSSEHSCYDDNKKFASTAQENYNKLNIINYSLADRSLLKREKKRTNKQT